MQKMQVLSLGQKDCLEKEMATHFSILAWKIPGTEEPDGPQSIGLQRDKYNLAVSTLKRPGLNGEDRNTEREMSLKGVWFLK